MPKSAGKHKEANQLSGMVVHNLIPIGENFALNINLEASLDLENVSIIPKKIITLTMMSKKL